MKIESFKIPGAYICSDGTYNWYLDSKAGTIRGYAIGGMALINDGDTLSINNDCLEYEFFIGNPPSPDEEKDWLTFTTICNFAVAKGLLRQITVYAVVQRWDIIA